MTAERPSVVIPPGERTVAVAATGAGTGRTEIVLTIENAIEDRVRAYSRLMRMTRILQKARGEP